MNSKKAKYGFRDYLTGDRVKWCPGCGNHGILRTMTQTFEALQLDPASVAVISGIGCSSRLPYYLNTYGFHTLHGRAPTVATGLKKARPDLSVWVVSGDGDSLAIGGNHLIHLARQNININMVIFNNAIYGLTKGQASPTTDAGRKTKSTPFGVEQIPLSVSQLAISSGASFVARTVDTHLDHMKDTMLSAYHHPGVSIVEVLVNCVIFNDGNFEEVENLDAYQDNVVELHSGKPMLFGGKKEKIVQWDEEMNAIVEEFKNASFTNSLQFHNPASKMKAFALANMDDENLPLPIGVLYQRDLVAKKYSAISNVVNPGRKGSNNLDKLLKGKSNWTFQKNKKEV